MAWTQEENDKADAALTAKADFETAVVAYNNVFATFQAIKDGPYSDHITFTEAKQTLSGDYNAAKADMLAAFGVLEQAVAQL